MEKPKRPIGLRKRAQKRASKQFNKMLKLYSGKAMASMAGAAGGKLMDSMADAMAATGASSFAGGAMGSKSDTLSSKKNKK